MAARHLSQLLHPVAPFSRFPTLTEPPTCTTTTPIVLRFGLHLCQFFKLIGAVDIFLFCAEVSTLHSAFSFARWIGGSFPVALHGAGRVSGWRCCSAPLSPLKALSNEISAHCCTSAAISSQLFFPHSSCIWWGQQLAMVVPQNSRWCFARWAHWGGAAGAVGKQIYSSDCKPL